MCGFTTAGWKPTVTLLRTLKTTSVGQRRIAQVSEERDTLDLREKGQRCYAGGVFERPDIVRSSPSATKPCFIEECRRQRGGKVDRQHLKVAKIAALEIVGPDPNPLIVKAFITPYCANLVLDVEIVINFDIELFTDIGSAQRIART
jgi:hypothetical protein